MFSIGKVAQELGISVDTIKRWEGKGLISKANRSLGGWRVYSLDDLSQIQQMIKYPTNRLSNPIIEEEGKETA